MGGDTKTPDFDHGSGSASGFQKNNKIRTFFGTRKPNVPNPGVLCCVCCVLCALWFVCVLCVYCVFCVLCVVPAPSLFCVVCVL